MSIIDRFISKRSEGSAQGDMPFIEHVEQLRWHVVRSVVALIIAAIFAWINISWIFDNIILGPAKEDFISYKLLCQLSHILNTDVLCMNAFDIAFQNTQLTGQFMTSFSVALTAGFIIAFPYILWEIWRFVKPALKPVERKKANGLVFWCSVLFLLGILFAYYVVAPFTINFFATFQLSEQFQNIITISSYYDTMLDLIVGMGIVFQLPILMYFLGKIGIVNAHFLRDKRRYAIVIIMFIAAIITPPDWLSIWLVALPLILLYELSILLIVNNKEEKERQKQLAIKEKYKNL
jgi:sec-independent protein translocase protein TatC